tara:strand:+ start:597 stop:959 length:363 start_codon:yes stop_codon:yes gene_type:complete
MGIPLLFLLQDAEIAFYLRAKISANRFKNLYLISYESPALGARGSNQVGIIQQEQRRWSTGLFAEQMGICPRRGLQVAISAKTWDKRVNYSKPGKIHPLNDSVISECIRCLAHATTALRN